MNLNHSKVTASAIVLAGALGLGHQAVAADYPYLADVTGELTAYCGAEEAACAVVLDKFNEEVRKHNGGERFEGKFVRLSTSEMIARVNAELDKSRRAADRRCRDLSGPELESCKDDVYRSKVDVLYYGTDDPYRGAVEQDMFSQFDYPTSNVHDWAADLTESSDGRLGGLYLGLLSLAVNTELLERANAKAPECWADLTDPMYKDEIVVANWNTSGTAYKFAANMLQAFESEQAGWDMVRDIHNNISQYTKSGSAGVKMAANGETMVGIGFAHDIVALRQQGFPVELIRPCEGVLYEIGPVGIVRGAENRAAAEAFATFLYEPEVQNLLAQEDSLQFPSNTSAETPEGAPNINNFTLLSNDPVYSTSEKKTAVVTKWTEEIFPAPKH